MDVLHELIPNAKRIAILSNPAGVNNEAEAAEQAARARGQQIIIFNAGTAPKLTRRSRPCSGSLVLASKGALLRSVL